jgi:hypothetical protein
MVLKCCAKISSTYKDPKETLADVAFDKENNAGGET